MKPIGILIFIFISFYSIFAESWTPRIKIINGTTGQSGRADSIKLIALAGGMVPIYEENEKQGEFSLPTQTVDERTPILIQVNYRGVNYNKMVPPVPKMRADVQEVVVYDTTDEKNFLNIRGLLQISKGENHLRVYKLFLLSNKTNPKKSISNSGGLEIFVPENAVEVSGQLVQGEKGMPVPLNLTKGVLGRIMERPILPGESSLQISYIIPGSGDTMDLEDRLTIEKENETLLFFKPIDMKISSTNALEALADEDMPEGMKAYRVQYDSERKVKLSFSGGKIEKEFSTRQRRIINGTVFDTTEKSILGVVAVLAFLFSLSFLFIYKK